MAPIDMDIRQNSTPFFGAAAFCMTKNYDFRRQPENEKDQKNQDNIQNLDNLKNKDEVRNENDT